jgi:hypothetical protein
MFLLGLPLLAAATFSLLLPAQAVLHSSQAPRPALLIA